MATVIITTLTMNTAIEFPSQNTLLEPIKNYEIIKNQNESPLVIEELSRNKENFEFEGGYVEFVLFQDLSIQKPDFLEYGDMKIFNILDDTWIKLLENTDTKNKDDDYILRIMGASTPNTTTPINSTIHIVSKLQNDKPSVHSIDLIRNKIVEEINVIRDLIPMKFKNEILTPQDSELIHIFGVVYDRKITFGSYIIDANEILEVDVEILGMMENGEISKIPEWIKIDIMNMPLHLKENIPDYFILGVSVNDAPFGSYEIALKETINQKIFIETVTITIVE